MPREMRSESSAGPSRCRASDSPPITLLINPSRNSLFIRVENRDETKLEIYPSAALPIKTATKILRVGPMSSIARSFWKSSVINEVSRYACAMESAAPLRAIMTLSKRNPRLLREYRSNRGSNGFTSELYPILLIQLKQFDLDLHACGRSNMSNLGRSRRLGSTQLQHKS